MTSKRTNPEFMNGVPELVILQLLARSPMHGYRLVQSIRLATNESLSFGEGCVYPLLHRLEDEGLLKSREEIVGARTRLVYHITAKGRQQLVEKVSSWSQVVQAVHRVVYGDERGVYELG